MRSGGVFVRSRGDAGAETAATPGLAGPRIAGLAGCVTFITTWPNTYRGGKAFGHAVMEGTIELSEGRCGPAERGVAIVFLISVTP